jgi:hypothetical protein
MDFRMVSFHICFRKHLNEGSKNLCKEVDQCFGVFIGMAR